MSASLYPFEGQYQNNYSLRVKMDAQLQREPKQDVVPSMDAIVQYVEAAICGIIPEYVHALDLEDQLPKRPNRDWLLKHAGQRQLVCLARQAEWVLLRKIPELRWSFPRIGKYFGRDHTTVMSGYKRLAIRS